MQLKVFKDKKISNLGDLFNELKRRFTKNITCSYVREVLTTKCCNGWDGINCDQRNSKFLNLKI